jgi:ABC-type multidrug transport system fused ATPase/permease subunit
MVYSFAILLRRIIIFRFRNSRIGKCLAIFPSRDRRKIVLVTLTQVFLGVLDLIGVAAFGVLGALAVNGIQSKQPGNRVSSVLDLLKLSDFSFQSQVAIIGVTAALILVLRTVFSVILHRRILFYISRKSAQISSMLIQKLLYQDLLSLQKRGTQETLFTVTSGVSAITIGVIGTLVGIVSDIALLLIMSFGLFVVDPTIAICTFLLFGIIGFTLYLLMHKRAKNLGFKNSELSISSNEKILEALQSYREIYVKGRRSFYAKNIEIQRYAISNVMAEISFMPNISKYVIETAVIIGTLLVTGIQFMQQDAANAVATLSVFLAAGTRISPAILRLQQGAIQIKSALGSADSTLDFIEEIESLEINSEIMSSFSSEHGNFLGEVSIENITFTYPTKDQPAANGISLSIKQGESVAFVGPSGGGKTTLADITLGLIQPDMGRVRISGLGPEEAIRNYPGAIAYVPQNIAIINGTILQNICLGYEPTEIETQDIWDALEVAQLVDFVKNLPNGFETQVGDRGVNISGGQRQRLGIARAVLSKPRLIVLDEATSSLDGQTEFEITDALHKLRGQVTVIVIAHRLSTVRNVDRLCYIDSGKIVSTGSFSELRQAIPDFERQITLSQIND